MDQLINLLSCLNENSTTEIVQSTFSEIAEKLLYKSHIVTGYGRYRMLEIEFYFRNSIHRDTITIPRKEEPGMWWLHEWGVDLSFKSNDKYYGGILIRSILDEVDNNYICGPQKCCQELFYSSALEECSIPRIVEDIDYEGKPKSTLRHVKGEDKGVDNKYRYYVPEIDLEKVKKYKDSPWNNS